MFTYSNIVMACPCLHKAVIPWEYFHGNTLSHNFTVHILGATSQLSNITSCVGDTITMNCTVESFAHIWDFGPLNEVPVTGGLSEDVVMMGFTFRLVEISNTAIVSSVTGTVIPELNNTVILCRDGNRPIDEGERQEVTASVIGECLINVSVAIILCTLIILEAVTIVIIIMVM